jgi:hypothetical protein
VAGQRLSRMAGSWRYWRSGRRWAGLAWTEGDGVSVSRTLRPGPASMRGLEWLARVGPSPLEPWRYAMGWSATAARSHARRLEEFRWLERRPMVRGEGSLFFATRRGVDFLRLAVPPATTPAPTWWAHDTACAWLAAWYSVRGRSFLGPRALLNSRKWLGALEWMDRDSFKQSGHRPDSSATGRSALSLSRSSSHRNRSRGSTRSCACIKTGSSPVRASVSSTSAVTSKACVGSTPRPSGRHR